jgi:hypothetical protein
MRKVMRKNKMMFGRVPALAAWGHNGDTVNLNVGIPQLAVLGALCQRAVAEHYSFVVCSPIR